MASLKPSLNRVLVKRLQADEKSAGGLYLPGQSQEKSQWAEVVAIGDGARYWDNVKSEMVTVPITYVVGEKVLIPKFGTLDLQIDGTEYSLIQEHEILGRATVG